jgi:hypothetical protein
MKAAALRIFLIVLMLSTFHSRRGVVAFVIPRISVLPFHRASTNRPKQSTLSSFATLRCLSSSTAGSHSSFDKLNQEAGIPKVFDPKTFETSIYKW